MTDALRLELAPWGISVSIIEPGAVATPIWEKGAKSGAAMLAAAPPEALVLYAEALEAFKKTSEQAAKHAVAPIEVARIVEHALTATRPRTRYVVGREAKFRAAMALLVPDRVRDNLPGKPAFCPLVFRTKTLEDFTSMDLGRRAQEAVARVPGSVTPAVMPERPGLSRRRR